MKKLYMFQGILLGLTAVAAVALAETNQTDASTVPSQQESVKAEANAPALMVQFDKDGKIVTAYEVDKSDENLKNIANKAKAIFSERFKITQNKSLSEANRKLALASIDKAVTTLNQTTNDYLEKNYHKADSDTITSLQVASTNNSTFFDLQDATKTCWGWGGGWGWGGMGMGGWGWGGMGMGGWGWGGMGMGGWGWGGWGMGRWGWGGMCW